jgi:uncharacterized membrane protein
MNRWIKPIAGAVLLAGMVHVATLFAIPYGLMLGVMRGAAEKAGGANTFLHARKTTPQNQTIVRPSPDLAYSVCSIDVSDGPVEVVVNRKAAPAVVALYATNTDMIWSTGDLVGLPGDEAIATPLHLFITRDQAAASPPQGSTVVTVPSNQVLLLVRRLAPTAEAFAAVDAERQTDLCKLATAEQEQS